MKNQIESLSAIVDLWWSWVDQCLAAGGCEINLVHACQGLFTARSLLATTGSAHQKSRIERRLSSSFEKKTRVSQDSSDYNEFKFEGARAMAALGDLDGQGRSNVVLLLWRDAMDIFLKFIITDEDSPTNA